MGNKLNDTGLRIVWNKVWSLVKSITGDVNVTEKGTLQKQIDDLKTDCFQSVSDGKALVASAITDKGVTTAPDATFATMAANIDAIETEMSLQSKSVSLSTSAQTVKPDSGYDGLSQVSVPAVTGTAAVGDVVVGKTFNSATAGIGKTGTLADKTGTADYSATASLDATNSRLKMKIPAQGKYGTGNYLYAAYSTIASLIGLTAAKLVKGNTILGITGNSNNMDTSGGDATAAQILSGKKACVDGELRTGTMTNRQGTTVDATAVSQDDTYTYFTTPAGSYSATSKVRTPNSNLSGKLLWTNPSPTSAFSGQTISVDLSNYKYFYVDYKFSTVETVTKRFYFKVDEVTNSSYQLIPSMFNTARTGTVYRALGRNSSGLIFNACLYCGTTSGATYNYSIDNTGMIPIAIYGCNSVVNLSV